MRSVNAATRSRERVIRPSSGPYHTGYGKGAHGGRRQNRALATADSQKTLDKGASRKRERILGCAERSKPLKLKLLVCSEVR